MNNAGTRRTGTKALAVNTAPIRLTAKKAQVIVGMPRNISPFYPFHRTKRPSSGRGFSMASASSVVCMVDVISS